MLVEIPKPKHTIIISRPTSFD